MTGCQACSENTSGNCGRHGEKTWVEQANDSEVLQTIVEALEAERQKERQRCIAIVEAHTWPGHDHTVACWIDMLDEMRCIRVEPSE